MHRLRYTSNLSEDSFHQRVMCERIWYHSFYFDNGFHVRGDYNVAADADAYGFPEDMTGMRVLDVGPAAGWFSFFFEQRGAEVYAVDARGRCDLDVYGRATYPPVDAAGRKPDRVDEDGEPVYYSTVGGAFWVMKEILASKVKFRNLRVYDLHPDLFGGRKFDLVFMGAVLCHLRDPIGALMAVHSVCSGSLMVTTPVVIGEPERDVEPRMYLPYTAIHDIGWWLPNEACFRHWFLAAGYRDVDVSKPITLRGDVEFRDKSGRLVNADQIHRLGVARVSR